MKEAAIVIKAYRKREHEAMRRVGFLAVQFAKIQHGKKARHLKLRDLVPDWEDLFKPNEQILAERAEERRILAKEYLKKFPVI